MTTISKLNNAQLCDSKRTAPRLAEAQHRLDTWNLSDKNRRRLEAFIASPAGSTKGRKAKAQAVTAGAGRRQADPAKAAAWALALEAVPAAAAAKAAGKSPFGVPGFREAYKAQRELVAAVIG